MAEEVRVRAMTPTSFESFEAVALEALSQIPGGAEGTKTARIVDQEVGEGGFVGRPQCRVPVVTSTAAANE
jgi:hypothetical protein